MTYDEVMIQRTARLWLGDLAAEAMSNLVRISAAFADNHVSWQVMVLELADDDEIEEYSSIFTEVLSDFNTATGDDTLIRLKAPEAASITPSLPIPIYPYD